MSYTPQAGDVIAYRGDKDCRVNILGNTEHESTMHVCTFLYKDAKGVLGVESKSVLSEMVNERGWTLIHREGFDAVFNGVPFKWDRKEVEDGK